MVPYHRAAEFEERTGVPGPAVLRIERDRRVEQHRPRRHAASGASGRPATSSPRCRSACSTTSGADVTATGGPGIAACKGAVTCLGYYDDPEANAKLYTPDGWMLTGDFCTIDADGYLTVVGRDRRTSSSAAARTSAPPSSRTRCRRTRPSRWPPRSRCPTRCSASACASTSSSTTARRRSTLDDLREHLAGRGVGKELWPERLVVVDAMPRSSGGKVAKGDLRADIRRRLADEEVTS